MQLNSLTNQKNRWKTIAIIALIIAIIIFGYYNCWFQGPAAKISLNWGPSYCLLGLSPEDAGGGSSGGSSGGSTNCDRCPPLSTRMAAGYRTAMTSARDACTTARGTWTENDYEVSCENPGIKIDCTSAAMVTAGLVCHTLGGAYRCQADGVYCWCPGSGPVPYGPSTICGLIVTWNSGDLEPSTGCGGTCSEGKNCMASGNSCECQRSDGYTCDAIYTEPKLICGGTCPVGYECWSNDGRTCDCYSTMI